MPRKKTQQPRPIVEDFPDPADIDSVFQEEDAVLGSEPEPELPRQSRKKNRNAHTKPQPHHLLDSSPEPDPQLHEPVAIPDPDASVSPPRTQSLLSNISFPSHPRSRPVDIREELLATEKVSDQYTPPSDEGLADDVYGKSPNSNAISSAANTPPVEPGFSNRHLYKTRSPPTSPPQRNVRPVSFGGSIPPVPSYARYPPSSYGSPPAPHLPQPHFYAPHDIDLNVPKTSQNAAVEESVFTRFIQLSSCTVDPQSGIMVGYDGRLNIYSFDGSEVQEVGVLSGLNGYVVDAELLRWTTGADPFRELRPLVAVNLMQLEVTDMGTFQHRTVMSVYSLSRRKHVCDLLHMPLEPSPVMHGPLATRLRASNHLCISASGNYVSVASGRSGEVFVFTPFSDGQTGCFECLGKFWTTIQPREERRDSSHQRTGTNISSLASNTPNTTDSVPIMALSGRWLAVCPPAASTYRAANIILAESVVAGRQAGLEALSAGSRPSVNCEVDSPDADTLLGKMARGVAQEMMKAGKWLGDQGIQYWQNYWKKDDMLNSSNAQNNYNNTNFPNPLPYGQFPPTHADTKATTRSSEVVSIFDLKSMHDSSARKSGLANPLATFIPPHGCSFLSFAPHGLTLFTASWKGDYQYVWDLFEMKHCRTLSSEADADGTRLGPRIRQLARFDRLSGSVIVDVVWEYPTLSRLALVTKNKTIHLFDLPPSAMRWPPPRRLNKSRPTSAPPAGPIDADYGAAPPGGFFASAMSIAGRTQPMLANLRGRAPSNNGGFAGIGQAGFGIATATAARGSKAVASGLSKSLGAATETVSTLQHSGQSRLHLKSGDLVGVGRIIWVRRASTAGVCILGGNGLKYYQVCKSRSRDRRQGDMTVFEGRRAATTRLPVPATTAPNQDDGGENSGFWRFESTIMNNTTSGVVHPLSFAEIDTNAPFQPFHSDHRVTLSITETGMRATQVISNLSKPTSKAQDQWAFGGDIPTTRLNITLAQGFDDDEPGSVIYRETSVRNDDHGDGEQIVSTTRRRKPKRGASAHTGDVGLGDEPQQEGFFEDDCDVLDFASDRV